MEKGNLGVILVVLFVLLIAINYNAINGFLIKNYGSERTVVVERVIDGDTIVVSGSSIDEDVHVRLLGINTPETTKDESYSEEAREFLEREVLNKSIVLEFSGERTDKYGRTLAYVFVNGRNINVEMVENGYAYYYFYSGEDKYSEYLKNAWEECIKTGINLCSISEDKCGDCVKIESSNKIKNNCVSSCDLDGWMIKGEGREEFYFNETLNSGGEKSFDIDLENSGRSLYLRDAEGKLVDWGVF